LSQRIWRQTRRRHAAGPRRVSGLRSVRVPRLGADGRGPGAGARFDRPADQQLTRHTRCDMSRSQSTILIAALCALSSPAAAQPPARPADPTRSSVPLPLGEYNRLIDLASRPPQPPSVVPVPAVVGSADLRVRVDRDAASGVFTLAGDVLRNGMTQVGLLAGI